MSALSNNEVVRYVRVFVADVPTLNFTDGTAFSVDILRY